MKYENLYDITPKASRLVYGSCQAMIDDDVERAMECLDNAYECGFRVFDTAYCYGHSEENIGKWMTKRGNRKDIILLDKGCNPGMIGSDDVMSQELIRKQNQESLDRLQTDYTDFYVLHRDDPSYPVEKVIDVLNELVDEGKVKRFGASNWSLERIQAANEYAKAHGLKGFSLVSPAYSLAELVHDPWGGSVSLAGAKNKAAREWYKKEKIPVFCYSSLGRGYLSGKFVTTGDKPIEECLSGAPIEEYDCESNRRHLAAAERIAEKKHTSVSAVCLAWLLQQELEVFPLVSPSSKPHMLEAMDAFDIVLTKEEIAELEA